MNLRRTLLLCLALAGSAVGQDVTVIACEEAFAALATPDDATGAAARQRFLNFLRAWLMQGAAPAGTRLTRPRNVVQVTPDGRTLIMQSTKEQMSLVEAMVSQLRRAQQTEMHVQCTLVTVPEAMATALRLEPGTPRPVDQAAAGKLLKDAVAAKGTIQNLPEANALPLTTFVVAASKKKDGTAKGTDEDLSVQGEGLLLADDEVMLALHLRRGPAAGGSSDQVEEATGPTVGHMVRLKSGAGALLTTRIGGPTTVLWVRLVAIATPVLPVKDGDRPTVGK